MSSVNGFFEESSEQSRVKSALVAKYFDAWAKVMMGAQNRFDRERKIAYIDLFAGPGRYKDGTTSTPLLVLKKAIQHSDLRNRLVTIFNDKDEKNSTSLEKSIKLLPGIKTLRYEPIIYNQEVGNEIVKMFEQMTLIPTLFFVDPWGYKGLSLRLVNSVLKDWGCDCLFFFNYNRISMGISNHMVQEHMVALFGKERAIALREKCYGLRPWERELVIVEELCAALRELGPEYVLPFRFKNDRGTRTSHHLIFVSKGFKGYEIMKEIMASESSSQEQGVASFEYNPIDARVRQPFLFQLSRPLDDLGEMLLKTYSGRSLSMYEVYKQHNVGYAYIKKNYKEMLMRLESEGKIKAGPHRQGTFGDNVIVRFPKMESKRPERRLRQIVEV
jgi:three-Cys-motif partner protein